MKRTQRCYVQEVQANQLYTSETSTLETPLSAENVERLMQESHFQNATQNMSPMGKAFLREHLNVKTNIAPIATFVERLVTASHSPKSTTNSTTIADLEVVAAAVNSIQTGNNRSKLYLWTSHPDLYLLTSHPVAGSALYNTYHKEESISVLGLKCVDPLIDKAAKEVETVRKTSEASKKTVTATHEAGAVVGVVGNPVNVYEGNGYQNQGQQNGPTAFQPKVLGWMTQQN